MFSRLFHLLYYQHSYSAIDIHLQVSSTTPCKVLCRPVFFWGSSPALIQIFRAFYISPGRMTYSILTLALNADTARREHLTPNLSLCSTYLTAFVNANHSKTSIVTLLRTSSFRVPAPKLAAHFVISDCATTCRRSTASQNVIDGLYNTVSIGELGSVELQASIHLLQNESWKVCPCNRAKSVTGAQQIISVQIFVTGIIIEWPCSCASALEKYYTERF